MISIAVCDDDKIYLNTVMRNLIKNVARICEIKVNVSFFVDGNSLLDEFRKEDADNHGFGTQIIREISEKYDGTYSWKAEKEYFIANVILKNI